MPAELRSGVLSNSSLINPWLRRGAAIVAFALVALGCGAPASTAPPSLAPTSSPASPAPTPSLTSIDKAQAIAVAQSFAAGNSATPPVLLEATREVLSCTVRPCPDVWTVSFAVTDASGKPGQASVAIDAATGTYMYSDWSFR